jgi:hypothetical protein
MTVVVQPILVGTHVDTIAQITPSLAQAIVAAGHKGVFRYVPFAEPDGSPQTDRSSFIHGVELGCILDAGLQCGLVSDVRSPPWLPKVCSGANDGRVASDWARSVGYPDGANLWLDWEGVAGTVADATTYLDAWSAAVSTGGFAPSLYVGYSAILSPTQLYDLVGFATYWQASGSQVATRGFAIRQMGAEIKIAGVGFDVDDVAPDLLGDLPHVAGVASPSVA